MFYELQSDYPLWISSIVSALSLFFSTTELCRKRKKERERGLSQVNPRTGWMDLFLQCSLLPILFIPVDLLCLWCYCSLYVCRSPTCTSTRVHVFGPFCSVLLVTKDWCIKVLRSESNKRIIYRATVHPFVFPLFLFPLLLSLSILPSSSFSLLWCSFDFSLSLFVLRTFVSIFLFCRCPVHRVQMLRERPSERQWHTKLTKDC